MSCIENIFLLTIRIFPRKTDRQNIYKTLFDCAVDRNEKPSLSQQRKRYTTKRFEQILSGK